MKKITKFIAIFMLFTFVFIGVLSETQLNAASLNPINDVQGSGKTIIIVDDENTEGYVLCGFGENKEINGTLQIIIVDDENTEGYVLCSFGDNTTSEINTIIIVEDENTEGYVLCGFGEQESILGTLNIIIVEDENTEGYVLCSGEVTYCPTIVEKNLEKE